MFSGRSLDGYEEGADGDCKNFKKMVETDVQGVDGGGTDGGGSKDERILYLTLRK